MRPLMLCLLVCTVFIAVPPCDIPMRPNHLRFSESSPINCLKVTDTFLILIFTSWVAFAGSLLFVSYIRVRYVPFNTNLSCLSKPTRASGFESFIPQALLCLLKCTSTYALNYVLIFHLPLDIYPVVPKI